MTTNDTTAFALADVRSALALLTRLPLPPSNVPPRGGQAAWAWPVAGALIGILAAVVAAISLRLGLSPGVAAAMTLAALAMLTGAMHEDGLADTADGFWGGWDKLRRLEIMKDSHIGSYGVLALILVMLARWSALSALLASGGAFAAIVAVAALSRAPMALVMAWLPNSRSSGLSKSVGQPTVNTAAMALGLGVLICFVLVGWQTLSAVIAVALVTFGVCLAARAKIGGQTGDTLGAVQQLAEVAALCAFAASLP